MTTNHRSPFQVIGGVRTETVNCEDQQFSADLSGLNLNSGLEEKSGPDSRLYWDGKRGLLFKLFSPPSSFLYSF